MITVYFAGHDSFGNRGCEALIRSNVKTLRRHFPQASFLVPSNNLARDAAQWPEGAAEQGVRFVPSEPIPASLRWWSRTRRVIKPVSALRPRLPISAQTCQHIASSDVLIMTGGDIISLDYGLESLYFWMSLCEQAMDAGVKTMLWGASVGPFSADPALERRMIGFLKRFDLITVRETVSHGYLHSHGIPSELVADAAFCLDPEPCRRELVLPVLDGPGPLLGFNVSPVIEKFRRGPEAKQKLFSEVVDFIESVVRRHGHRVLLVPHVDPFDQQGAYNSDSLYLARVLRALRGRDIGPQQLDLLPGDLNAAELKSFISVCDYFIGGRTHATLAALSSSVPTVSIAYSIKARGINRDLFGHEDFVLDTPLVSSVTLEQSYQQLLERGQEVAQFLTGVMPEWRKKSFRSAALLETLLSRARAV